MGYRSIDQIRQSWGEDWADASDGEVLKAYTEAAGVDPRHAANYFGYDPTGGSGDFMRGLKQSGHELVGTGYGLVGLAGAAAGNEDLKQWGLTRAQRRFDQSNELGLQADQVQNIESFGDAADWLQHGMGYVVGQAIPSIVTGGVGAMGGKMAVGAGVRGLAAKEVAGSAAEAAAIQAARAQVGRAAVRGGIAGSAIASYGQEAGSMYPEMVSEGHDDWGRAALYALPAAALDVIPEARAIKGIFSPAARAAGRGLLRNAGEEAFKQAAIEGGTEILQTAIERAAAYKDLSSHEAMLEYLNAGALGALGGGMMGGITGLTSSANDPTVETSLLGAPETRMGLDPKAVQGEMFDTPGPHSPIVAPPTPFQLDIHLEEAGIILEKAQEEQDAKTIETMTGVIQRLEQERAKFGPDPAVEVAKLDDQLFRAKALMDQAARANDAEEFYRVQGIVLQLEQARDQFGYQAPPGAADTATPDMFRASTATLPEGVTGYTSPKPSKAFTPNASTPQSLVKDAATGVGVDPVIADAAAKVGLSLVNSKGNKPLVGLVTAFTKAIEMVKVGAIDPVMFNETIDRLKGGVKNVAEVNKALAEADADFVAKKAQGNIGQVRRVPKEGAANVSVPVQSVQPPAGSVGGGGAVVPGPVAVAGPSAVVAGTGSPGPARVAATNAATDALPNEAVQRAAPVVTEPVAPQEAPVVPQAIAAGEPVDAIKVVRRKRVVDPKALAQAQAFVAPEPVAEAVVAEPAVAPAPELSEEDLGTVAEETGQGGIANAILAEEAGTRIDAEQLPPEAAANIIAQRFKTSKNAARDTEILGAYLMAMRDAPHGEKGKVVAGVAAAYGVKPETVRKIGNTTKLVEAGAELGFSADQVRQLYEVADNTKSAEASTATEADNVAVDTAANDILRAAGIDTADGLGGDDASNVWKQGRDGMGDTANAKDEAMVNELIALTEAKDKLRALADDFVATNPGLVPLVVARIKLVEQRVEAAQKKLEEYLTGKTKKVSAKVSKELAKEQKGTKAPKRGRGAPEERAEVEPEADLRPARERAADAWNEVADEKADIGFPRWEDLKRGDQKDFIDFGPDNWTAEDVITHAQNTGGNFVAEQESYTDEYGDGTAKFGTAAKPGKKKVYTAATLLAELKDFIRADIPGRKLVVVDTIGDLLLSPDRKLKVLGAMMALQNAYGVASDGRAVLIADRIKQGTGRAKFMHEVGGHLGLENLLGPDQYKTLTDKIVAWARADNGSIESEIALDAVERVSNAGTEQADRRSEMLAYFIEAAMDRGIDPTAYSTKGSAELNSWFRTLWAAFKNAVRKLGVNVDKMTAQDVVNLAYGAARLEMNGVHHGTAPAFRNIRHTYMGTGEGAQAFGWGTYAAEDEPTALGYMVNDVMRKAPRNKQSEQHFRTQLDEVNAAIAELHNMVKPDDLTQQRHDEIKGDLIAELVDMRHQIEDRLFWATRPVLEGSLMRLDTAVAPDEWLRLDLPMGDQSDKVKKAFKDIMAKPVLSRTIVGDELLRLAKLSTKPELAVNIATSWIEGKGTILEITKQLAGDKYETQVGEQLKADIDEFFDKYAEPLPMDMKGQDAYEHLSSYLTNDDGSWGQLGGDKLASEALDKLGVKGVMFPDSKSRKIKDMRNWTFNRVVFNDRNIQRVSTAPAGDKTRPKFGVASDLAEQYTPMVARPAVRSITTTLKGWGRRGLNAAIFTEDLLSRAVNKGLSSAKEVDTINRQRAALMGNMEREVERISQMYRKVPAHEQGVDEKSVNRFVYDSTREGKWAFQPEWRTEAVTVDPKLAARFNALSTPAKDWVRAVFKHGDDNLKLKQTVVNEATNDDYQALIDAANARGDKRTAAKLQQDKINQLARFDTLFRMNQYRPYAPMKRFGDWVVIAKSDKYLQAEADGNVSAINKLQMDPEHYHVNFAESEAEADKMTRELQAEGEFDSGKVVYRQKDTTASAFDGGGMLTAFQKLKHALDGEAERVEMSATMTPDQRVDAQRAVRAAAKAREVVSQLYLSLLAESSARKAEMRRRGVAGELDMLRSFATQGRADATFVAAAKHGGRMQEVLNELRKQVRRGEGDENAKSELFNEIAKRHEQSLTPRESELAQKATRLTSVWLLATSPAYYLQNMTQPFMMSLPVMAGRHNYMKTAHTLVKAYGDLVPMHKDVGVGDAFNLDRAPKDVEAMLKVLADRGRIDIGINTELGRFRVNGDSMTGNAVNKADELLFNVSQKMEAINRITTAVAAYRMELAKTGSTEQALEYADSILSQTHGDYTAINAPRVFNHPAGRVMLQFRKFQLIQATMIAKMVKGAIAGDSAARKALAYTLAHTGVMAGAAGLPGYAAVSFLAKTLGLLGDEPDDPEDMNTALRRAIGDEDYANLLLKGIPAALGVDLSRKLGMTPDKLLPFGEIDLSSRSGAEKTLATVVGGPAGGLALRALDGINLMRNGDYYRGLEQLLPTGFTNMAKAYRESTDGITKRNGDMLVSPDEINAAEALSTAIGFPTTAKSNRQEDTTAAYDLNTKLMERSKKIKADYLRARKEGDAEGASDARDRWMQLQALRASKGFPRLPLSQLMRTESDQRKRERNTVDGMQFNRDTSRYVRELAEE
jgi:hypothetical protein